MSIQKGKHGEAVALNYLKKKKYTIIAQNVYCRHGEIDLIAQIEEETLVFIEVKNYKTKSFLSPLDSITNKKIQNISQTAQWYLQQNNIEDKQIRFDLITVKNNLVINHLKNIF
jgi:putative endonuclease